MKSIVQENYARFGDRLCIFGAENHKSFCKRSWLHSQFFFVKLGTFEENSRNLFITTKFEGFTLFFGLQISVFKTATIKLALHGTNTHICVRYIKHTFFLHQKGVCFSSRCCPLKKAIKAKIDLFFLRSSGLSC